MSKLQKRSFGIVFVESKFSNYNGNPEEADTPRLLIDNHGMMSPPCVKHKIRELIEDHDNPVWKYLKAQLDLDDEHFFVWESALKGYKDVKNPKEAKDKHWGKQAKAKDFEYFVQRFWDMRVFGTTALEDKKEDSLKFTKTGCVSVSPFISLAPVEIINQTITKGNPLEEKHLKTGQGTIAPFGFKVARHAVFSGFYVVNPSRAHYTGTTEKDIEVFKSLIPYAFSNSTAASRAGVNVVQAIHVTHENPLGSFNESELYEFCRPTVDETVLKNGSQTLSQYSFKTKKEIEKRFPHIKIEMIVDFLDESRNKKVGK